MSDTISNARIAQRFASTFVVMAAALFVSAGTVFWPEAWIYIAIHLSAAFLMTRWLLLNDPELLKKHIEMEIPARGSWDALFMWPGIILFIIYLIIPGLDAVRFGWSQVPFPLQLAGLLLVVAGLHLIFRSMCANSFASPLIEVQREREHRLVDTGPYAHVRHPMYSGIIVILLALPLWLGSFRALPMALLIMLVIVVRIFAEERLLRGELEGYRGYCQRVHYRLIPKLW